MKKLLPAQEDFEQFKKIIHEEPLGFIRCNTLKISTEKLLEKLNKKWVVEQPFPKFPEIMLIISELKPGELGNSIEHTLGYYYIQEISSMLPPLALDPKPGELVLDLFASPGSKTTQIAARMENKGTIIANDLKLDRISILVTNSERCGVTNSVVTRSDALSLCSQLKKANYKFDKILLDVPCSGEGTLRSSPKTFLIWNENVIKSLSKKQKKFFAAALPLLKVGGTLVYSTCTHATEENEKVIDHALSNFPVKIETLHLPIKCRPGVSKWKDEEYNSETKKACRIYPQDNNTEGFFVSKFTLLEEVK